MITRYQLTHTHSFIWEKNYTRNASGWPRECLGRVSRCRIFPRNTITLRCGNFKVVGRSSLIAYSRARRKARCGIGHFHNGKNLRQTAF